MAVNKLTKALKKHWITLWLVVAALSLAIVATFAIYTRITIAKRVISTQAGVNSLFSSDHMNSTMMKVIEPMMNNSRDAEVPVYVFNYAYPKESVYREDETEYELSASIGKLDLNDNFTPLSGDKLTALGAMNYSITHNTSGESFKFGTGGSASYTFKDRTIAGGAPNFDQFTLVFDKNEVSSSPNDYCMKLVATPYNSDLPVLTGYVMVRYSKQANTGWSGALEEIDADKEDDYDGYNYYLEGNGKGRLTFRWNAEKLAINPDFLNNPNNSFSGTVSEPDANGMSELTINVDSANVNRYEIQFYKVDSKNYSYSRTDVEHYLPDTDPTDWVPDE